LKVGSWQGEKRRSWEDWNNGIPPQPEVDKSTKADKSGGGEGRRQSSVGSQQLAVISWQSSVDSKLSLSSYSIVIQ